MLKNLEEQELELVSDGNGQADADQPGDCAQEILREFSEVAVQAGTAALGGVGLHQNASWKNPSDFSAPRTSSAGSPPSPVPLGSMRQIVEMDVRQLFNLLKEEQPQTVALVASYLSPEKTSQFLTMSFRRRPRPDRRAPGDAGADAGGGRGSDCAGAERERPTSNRPAP